MPRNNRNNRRQGSSQAPGQDTQMGGARPQDNQTQGQNGGNARNNSNAQNGGGPQRTDRSPGALCTIHQTQSHTNGECRQQQRNGQDNGNTQRNQNNNNNGRACHRCHQTDHMARDCPFNPIGTPDGNGPTQTLPQNIDPSTTRDSSPQRVNGITYQHTEASNGHSNLTHIAYCAYCNVANKHWTKQCLNDAAQVQFLRAKIVCRLCRVKGHLEADCENPVFTKCSKCHRRGHNYEGCRSQPDQSPEARLTNYADSFKNKELGQTRFKWEGEFQLTEAQRMKVEWEKLRREQAANNIYPNEAYIAATERSIQEAEQREFDVRQVAFTAASSTRTRVNVQTASPSSQPTSIAQTISNLRASGLTDQQIFEFEEFARHKNAERESSVHNLVRQKKNNSSYGCHHANNYIRAHENAVVIGLGVVQTNQMYQVGAVMRNGGQFFRDSRAMAALFEYKRPVCMCCHQRGSILNAGLLEIPYQITTKEILDLQDHNDWGLFVGFACSCSATRQQSELRAQYSWEPIPHSLMEGFVDVLPEH